MANLNQPVTSGRKMLSDLYNEAVKKRTEPIYTTQPVVPPVSTMSAGGTTTDTAATSPAAGTTQQETTTPSANQTTTTAPAAPDQSQAGGTTTPSGNAQTPAGSVTPANGTAANGTTGSGNTQEDALEQMKILLKRQYSTATDQSEMLKKLYEANLKAQKERLENSYNENLSGLDAEKESLAAQYAEMQRRTAADAAKSRANWNETANAYGLNSGTQGQAQIAMNNQLQSNLNTLNQVEMQKRAEIERQRQLLGQKYQSAIQEAQANNDMELAKALYEEAVRLDNSITDEGIVAINRAISRLTGSSGGSSGGYYGGYYGGGSGGSSSGEIPALGSDAWYNYITDSSGANGQDAGSYILSNYKKLGIPYSQLKSYLEKYNDATRDYVIGSAKGKEIISGMRPGDSVTVSDGSTWTMQDDGTIIVNHGNRVNRPGKTSGNSGSSGGSGKSSSSKSSGSSSSSGTKKSSGSGGSGARKDALY
nr:MAG TPA: hypothetical protein [Caudoviricetes sp.]